MNMLSRVILPASLLGAAAVPASAAEPSNDPMRFFEGRTESISTIKIMLKKPYRSRSIGRGTIASDGSLHLVQRVEEQGKPARERRWHIRKTGPGRYSGTMSEAQGPVTIREVGGRYRFDFKMKGNMSVEQWLTPAPDGKSARNQVSVRKFGVVVGRSEGTIRKVD
jgi:hypothetical protein